MSELVGVRGGFIGHSTDLKILVARDILMKITIIRLRLINYFGTFFGKFEFY